MTPEGSEVRRFRSQRVAALLAYLCLHLGRDCPREELAEALWPDEDPQVTANRLRVSLTSLRHQLELPGMAPGSVLDATRAGYVRLRSESVWCDVAAFEKALKQGNPAEAAQLACGALLPGFYDEWILMERERLEALRTSLPQVVPAPLATPEVTTPVERRLPVALTRFFGRATEQERLTHALTEERLVTLVGLGGMGKSRLAVETARRLALPSVFVPLADLTEEARLGEFVLRALGASTQGEGDPLAALGTLLTHRGELLLILDNAEHLASEVAALTVTLLEKAPELRILATSRQPLGILGERVLTLEPLELPSAHATPERLLEFPSVALFCDRARQVRPDFVLTPRHTPALIAICQKLEGMPLALELAAARTRTQTPTQLAAALDESLLTLATTQRGLPERHRSLRAVVESSVAALDPALQAFFAALSVFQGGWTSEAAEAITGCPQTELFLEELTHHSLITLREDELSGTMRFGFLETLRLFAAERCTEKERLAERHASYFFALAAQVNEDDVRFFDPLEPELENLALALDYGWEHLQDRHAFWDGLTGFLAFAFVRGHHRRAIGYAERIAASWQCIPEPEQRFEALNRTLMLYNDLGRNDEVARLATEMLTQAQARGLRRWESEARMNLGYVANQAGRYEKARQIQREALELARTLDNPLVLVRALFLVNRATNPCGIMLLQSDPQRAAALLAEAEAVNQEALRLIGPHSRFHSILHMGLALSLFNQGRTAESYQHLKACQHWALKHGTLALLMYAFWYESSTELVSGSPERAALLYGAFCHLRERMGYSANLGVDEHALREHYLTLLDEETYECQLRLAHSLSLETLVAPRTWDELVAGKISPKIAH
nr:AAA family ATPase [Armatimonas rosea]